MKKFCISLFLFLSLAPLVAQEMNFEQGSWTEIRTKAREQNKLIFLDAYTTWCGPCKSMAKNIFTDTGVAAYYNSNFINAKIDMEKGEGPEIAGKYNVNCYPNLLYIDGNGNLIHRSAGYKNAEEFIALGKTAQVPDKTFSSVQKQVDSGNSDPAFIAGYLHFLSFSCLPANDAAVKYFSKVKEEEMILPENWAMIRDYVTDIHSAPFIYLVKNRIAYAQKYNTDSVNAKIFDAFLNNSNKLVFQEKFDSAAMRSLVAEADKIGFERGEELHLTLELPYYERLENWNAYFNTAKSLVEKYKQKDDMFLNNVSWAIYEKCTDKSKLAEAEQWAKKSVEIKEEYYNLDTYASLLFRNGKKGEAVIAEKKAIDMAKSAGMDTHDLEQTLLKFQEKK